MLYTMFDLRNRNKIFPKESAPGVSNPWTRNPPAHPNPGIIDMNKQHIATGAGLLGAATVLIAHSIHIERRLARLESAPPPPKVASGTIPFPTRGSATSVLEPPADAGSIANLATRHDQARAEVADPSTSGPRLIGRRGMSHDIDQFTGFIPQQAKIERWNGEEKRSWGHEQAAGEPDTHQPGDIPSAWASKTPDGGEEWLKLDYDRPVDLQQIRVFESHNPGAISKVAAILPDGRETTLWEGTLDPSHEAEVVASEFLVKQAVRAQSVKVYLDTTRVPGWNEIDAVQLVGRDGSKQWASASSSSTSYADR